MNYRFPNGIVYDELPPGVVPLRPDQINMPPPMASLSQPGKRLYWTLQGPLSSSIFVLGDELNPDGPRQPYFRQTPEGTTSWHPVGQEPATTEPVASLTVHEENLDDWANEWATVNQEGFDEDVQPSPQDVPPKFEPLVVTASNGEFVTLHDYVSAVHPWLMARRQQILEAKNVADDNYVVNNNTRLLVEADRPEMVFVEDEQEWHAALRQNFEERRRLQQDAVTQNA